MKPIQDFDQLPQNERRFNYQNYLNFWRVSNFVFYLDDNVIHNSFI